MTNEQFVDLLNVIEVFEKHGIIWDPQVGDNYAYLTDRGLVCQTVRKVYDAVVAPLHGELLANQVTWIPTIQDKLGAILVITNKSMESLLTELLELPDREVVSGEIDPFLLELDWLDSRLTQFIIK